MPEFIDKAKAQVLLYKIAIIFVILYSLDSIATAFVSVMIDTSWDDLNGTQKWIRVALIAKAWASSMLAFFTNVGKKLQNEKPLFDDEPPPAPPSASTKTQISVQTETKP